MVNPFFIPYWGGTEKVIYEISRRLVKDFDITVLTSRLKGTKKEEYIEGIRVVREEAMVINKLPKPLPPPYVISPAKPIYLISEAKKHKVVHFHNRFFYNPIDFTLAKSMKKKVVLTLHNSRPMDIDPTTDFLGQMYDDTVGRVIFDACDYITAVSKDTLEKTLREKKFRKKARVIYNGVDEKVFNPKVDGSEMREKLGVKDNEVMILTIARLVEQKGIDYLVDAAGKLKNENIKVIILGKGPKEEEIKNRIKELKLNRKVKLVIDRLPAEDIPKMYAASDIFVLPSLYEPFGLVVAEAMATGKPVVASRIGGIPEVMGKGTGFLVRPRSSDELAEKLSILINDEKARKKMGKNGRRRIEKYFTWDKIANDYKSFYNEILSE